MSALRRVGFAGIGRIGGAMFGCVLDAGLPAAAYDIRPDALDEYRSRSDDLIAATSPADLARQCEVVDVIVNTDEQMLDVCLRDDGLIAGAAAGTAILLHSTITQETLRTVAAAAAAKDVHVLDAPISGRWGHRSAGELCVMVGGDAGAFEQARPVLETFGSLVVHLGPLGSALDTKLALNLVRYVTFLSSREALSLLAAAGVQAPFAEIVDHTGAMEVPGAPKGGGPRVDIPMAEMTPAWFEHNAAMARKDLRAAVARGAELGLDLVTTARAIDRIHTFWGAPAPADPLVD